MRIYGMKSKDKFFILLIFITFLLMAKGLTVQENFVISDQFERARIAETIVQSGYIGLEENVYGLNIERSYAPLFDILSASMQTITNLSMVSIFKLLGIITAIIIGFYAFKIANLYLPRDYSFISAIITLLIPWLFKRLVNPIPETFGLMFYTVGFYFLIKKDYKKLAIIFPAFALFHFRSFLTFFIIFFITSIYFIFKNKTKAKEVILPIITSTLTGIWFLPKIKEIFSLKLVSNPWITFLKPHEMFSFLFYPGLILALILAYKKKKKFIVILFITFTLIYVLAQSKITAMREVAYLFLILPLILTIGLHELQPKLSKNIVLGLLALSVFYLWSVDNSILEEHSYFNSDNIKTMQKINEIEGKIVLSDFIGSYVFPYISNKKVIIGAFMEEVPDADSRLKKSFNAFKTCEFTKTMNKYNAKILHVSPYSKQFIKNCDIELIQQKNPELSLISSEKDHEFYVLNN